MRPREVTQMQTNHDEPNAAGKVRLRLSSPMSSGIARHSIARTAGPRRRTEDCRTVSAVARRLPKFGRTSTTLPLGSDSP